MEVAVLTVGDEVLAGDTANTNAAWIASQLTERGVTVARILTIPDDRELIESTIESWRVRFDAVVVTGGLGGTHDDVTVDALADAFDRDLAVDDHVRQDVIETVADYRDRNPETVAAHELNLDVDAWAALPAGSRALINPEGLCPGCVIENVYAFPGVPAEMKATFETVASEFGGDVVSRTLYTTQPESSMIDALTDVQDRYGVAVGSYPDVERRNRVKVLGTDETAVAEATAHLRDCLDFVDAE